MSFRNKREQQPCPLYKGFKMCRNLQVLPQSYFQAFLRSIGPSQESIEQAFLNAILLPDRRSLYPHAFVWLYGSLIAGSVEDGAAAEVSYILHELNDR